MMMFELFVLKVSLSLSLSLCIVKILRTLGPQIAIVIIFAPLKPYDEERETQLERNIYYPVSSVLCSTCSHTFNSILIM